jgi:predicted DCC family thiol-disulfide oxidoreductase YuxK
VIVLYDDDCGFCRWTVAWALARDCRRVLTPAAILSDKGTRLLGDITPAAREASMHVVHADGRRESGGAALRAVLVALPSTRVAARLAGVFPRATDALYAFVARHRTRFARLVRVSARRRADARLAESCTRGLSR